MSKPLICIIGASGAGKSSVCKELTKKYNLKQIPSYTTRSRRNKEDELGHTFVSPAEFAKLKSNLCAYAITTGAEYGVTYEQLNNEDYCLYVVDYTGFKYLQQKYKGDRKIVSIFLDCPLAERYSRLHKRYEKTETYSQATETALTRIEHDAVEFKGAKENCDYVIDNRDNVFNRVMAKIITICVVLQLIAWEGVE